MKQPKMNYKINSFKEKYNPKGERLFFSKNIDEAKKYADEQNLNGKIVLHEHQIPHGKNWNTYKVIKK